MKDLAPDSLISETSKFLMSGATARNIDQKLREIMAEVRRHHPSVLAMWLRLTSRMTDLPTWQPLLNHSIEVSKEQGVDWNSCFRSLVPDGECPRCNTELNKV